MPDKERKPRKITIGQRINRRVIEFGYSGVVLIGVDRFFREDNLARTSAEVGLGWLASQLPKKGARIKKNGKHAEPRVYMAAALAVPVLGATNFGSVQGKLEVGIGLLTPGVAIAIAKTEERITRHRSRNQNPSTDTSPTDQ